jgi:hypothetical protein
MFPLRATQPRHAGSLPSPCGRLSRLTVLWSDLTPHGPSGGLLLGWSTLPSGKETAGPPRFLTPLFLRATLSDPGRPSRISPERSRCIGFRFSNTVATCSIGVTRLNRFGECGLPCGPQDSLCTLRTFRSFALHCILLMSATLDTGGWLGLTRRGLAPRKKMPSFAWRTSR